MLKKGDFVLILVVAAVILASFGGVKLLQSPKTGAHRIAIVKQNDKVIKRVDLDKMKKTERIEIGGDYQEILLIENGNIRFEEANCPDKICVKTGWLTKNGDMAVCLPNRTIVKIEGEDGEVDGTTY